MISGLHAMHTIMVQDVQIYVDQEMIHLVITHVPQRVIEFVCPVGKAIIVQNVSFYYFFYLFIFRFKLNF